MTIVLGFVLFQACHKEVSNLKDSSFTGENSLKTGEMSQEDQIIYHKLLKFKSELDSITSDSSYISTWNLSVDSSLWYFNAFINAKYSFSTSNYTDFVFDTLFINLGKDYTNQVNFNEMHVAYKNILSGLSETLSEINAENKELYFVFIGDVFVDHNELFVSVLIGVGIDPTPIPSLWDPFGSNEEWWFGETAGDCSNNYWGTDAAEKIESKLNTYLPNSIYWPTPPSGYHYFDDPFAPQILYGYEYPNPDDKPPTPDNEEDFLIYYCDKVNHTPPSITTFEKCLDGVELNFYYWSEREVILELFPEDISLPDNWVFTYCHLEGQNIDDYSVTRHFNTLFYSLRTKVPDSFPYHVELPVY